MSEYDLEVSKLKRDLRFFPVSNPSPKKSTAEQIQTYNEKGYLTGFRLIFPHLCVGFRGSRNRRNSLTGAAFTGVTQAPPVGFS
jgi:hypothetical protein